MRATYFEPSAAAYAILDLDSSVLVNEATRTNALNRFSLRQPLYFLVIRLLILVSF